jgi:hypothetical protein
VSTQDKGLRSVWIYVTGVFIVALVLRLGFVLLVGRGDLSLDEIESTEELEEITASKQSLMPAGLLDSLTDDEIRDLFAYLVSTTPPK